MSDSTTLEEENKRVSLQVSSLSTQLIDLVGRQSQLEDQVQHKTRENEQLNAQLKEFQSLQTRYKDLDNTYKRVFAENQKLSEQIPKEIKEKEQAKLEVSQLQKEVEELSASLFDEANHMVADANRKAHDFSKRNESLITQLQDKDLLLVDLQTQLRELKEAILDREEEEGISSASHNNNSSKSNSSVLFSPTVTAIRYDLKLYAEFRKFLNDSAETVKYKESKFFRKLYTDDIEPSLKLDSAPGIGWLHRRPLVSAMVEGRVVIEPVSGINETYLLNFQKRQPEKNNSNTNTNADEEEDQMVKSNLYAYPRSSPPVAISTPCSLCGESRDDILEHSRLYTMRFHPKDTLSTTLAQNVNTTYALCSYCLFRVRSTCDILAFIRSLKTTDIWKLTDEVIVKKAWIELSRLRSRLFWAKVGVWDVETNILTTKITPSREDNVYHCIKTQDDPASRAVHQFGSTESLNSNAAGGGGNDSVSVLNSPTVEYKSSPLAQEIKEKKLNEEEDEKKEEGSKRVVEDNREFTPEPQTEQPQQEEIPSHEREIDILDDYAEEEEEEEESKDKLKEEEKEEDESATVKPSSSDSEFSFEKNKPTREEEKQEKQKEVKDGSTETTGTNGDDDDEFVDA